MKLFTKEIDNKLFDQYQKGSDLENQKVVAKIFNPYGRGTWYLLNSDPQDPDYIWAIVDLFEVEMGSVSRSELESIKVPPFGLGLERDLSFTPINAYELYMGLLNGKQYAEGGITKEKYIVSFNYNPSNLKNSDAEKIVSKYTNNWSHDNDFDEVSFYVIGLSKENAEELVAELKMEDAYNIEIDKSRYAYGGMMSEGGMMANGGQTSLFEEGGSVAQQNKEMLKNQAKEFMHHSQELNSLVDKTKQVDAWVVAKAERASTDLSDITHYLDGRIMAKGGQVAVNKMSENELKKWLSENYGFRGVDGKGITRELENRNIKNMRKEVLSQMRYKEMAEGRMMAKGGNVSVDLFEYYQQQPPKLKKIVNKWASKYDEDEVTYKQTEKFLKEVEAVGYTFDYGLDNMPYGLRPIGTELEMDWEQGGMMAKGGKVSKDFKVGDNVIYTDATNGKWYGRNNVSNIKEGVISNIQEISNTKLYTINRFNKFGVLIDTYNTSDLERIEMNTDLMAKGGMMAKGGKTTFKDKVNAISKRLEGTKVPTRLKKDYGATYDKKEAKQAGQRIAGSMIQKLKMRNK